MDELVKNIPEIKKAVFDDLPNSFEYDKEIRLAKGAPLRAFRKLLDHLDVSQVWGNLSKVLTPEGHYLWLCPYHQKEYEY